MNDNIYVSCGVVYRTRQIEEKIAVIPNGFDPGDDAIDALLKLCPLDALAYVFENTEYADVASEHAYDADEMEKVYLLRLNGRETVFRDGRVLGLWLFDYFLTHAGDYGEISVRELEFSDLRYFQVKKMAQEREAEAAVVLFDEAVEANSDPDLVGA